MVYIIYCMRPPSTTTTTNNNNNNNSSSMIFFFLLVSWMCLYFAGRRLLLLSIAVVAVRYHPVAGVVSTAADGSGAPSSSYSSFCIRFTDCHYSSCSYVITLLPLLLPTMMMLLLMMSRNKIWHPLPHSSLDSEINF